MNLSVLCILLLTFTGLLSVNVTVAHNVLAMFPHFGYSHFKVFHPLLYGLAERGHNVTVVTYTKNPKPHPNYHELILVGVPTINVFALDDHKPSRSFSVMYEEFWLLHNEGQKSCETLFKSGFIEKLLDWHKKSPFDLVIMEYFNTDCYLAVPEILNVPVVGLSSCSLMPWYYDRIRLPDTPSYVQSQFIGFPEILSFGDRVTNFVQAKLFSTMYSYNFTVSMPLQSNLIKFYDSFFTYHKDNELIKRHLGIEMDVEEVSKRRTSLIMVNQHYTLSGPRPFTPQLIEMGGIHIDETQDANATLPQHINDFLNKVQPSEKLIFISWGSMVRFSSVDKLKLGAMIETFAKLNMKAIWKWETDELPVQSDNFLFVKWAPQAALLRHAKVDFFWSHGGNLGTTEGVYYAKPMIVTPIYGDQFVNGYGVQNRGAGVMLDYSDINQENLEKVLKDLIDGGYTQRAKTLSKLFKERDMPPLQKTIWWVEHILKNGPISVELLRTKAVYLHWFDYHSLDVISCILLMFFITYYIFNYLISLLFVSNQVNENISTMSREKNKKKRN